VVGFPEDDNVSAATLLDTFPASFRQTPNRKEALAPISPAPGLRRKVDAIRALALFADIPEQDLVPMATSSLLRRFERGRRIGRLGARDECLVLVSGRAKTSTPRGVGTGELTLATFDAGDILSETCWATGQAEFEGEAIALSDCEVLFLSRRGLEDLLSGHGEVALRLLIATVNKLSKLTRLATRRSGLDVGDRLYCKLAEFAETLGRRTDDGIVIKHGLQQNELAASIGASREAVNRQLGLWRDEGFITSSRGAVLVRDLAGLRMAVSPEARTIELDLNAPIA